MPEIKNVKRNKTRPHAKDRGLYSGLQRNYTVTQKQQQEKNNLKLI